MYENLKLILSRPLNNKGFCFFSRRAKILSAVILSICRALKFLDNTEKRQNGKLCKGLFSQNLDKICSVTAALLPVGMISGSLPMELTAALTCLLWIIRTIISKDSSLNKIVKSPIIISWILLIISITATLIANNPSGKAYGHDFAYVRFLIFTIAIADISYRLPIYKYLIYGLAAGVIFAVLNILSAYIFGFDLAGRSALIYYGNKLGAIARIMVAAPFAASFFLVWGFFDKELSKNKRNKIIAIGLIAAILTFFTKGRTLLIGIAGAFCFSIFYFFYKRNNSLKAALIFIIAIILLIGSFAYFSNYYNYGSFYHRIWIWKVSIAMWLENPFFGVGIADYEEAFKKMALSGNVSPFIAPNGAIFGPNSYSEANHAHSFIIMPLACNGLLGLLAFLSIFISIVINIFKNITDFRAGLIGWIAAFFIIGLTGFNIYHSIYMAYFAFFVGLTLCRTKKLED